MKRIVLIFSLAAFTSGFAQVDQNKNKMKTTTVTKRVVTDNEGSETSTKAVTQTRTQELALTDFEGEHNFSTVMKLGTVDTDVKYMNNNNKYWLTPDKPGYKVMTNINGEDHTFARIRPTSQDGYYLHTQDGENSIGYFNEDGDFVVESYDSDNDGVYNYIYKVNTVDKDKMKKNKMK